MAKTRTAAPAGKTLTVEQIGSPIRRESKQRATLIGLKLNKLLSYVFAVTSLLTAVWSHVNRRE